MILRQIYKFLSSSKLAMALLVAILACCIAGVTLWRGAEAGAMIFGTLWFNGLLVLLVVNVACCFFPRMWGRKLTLISVGMILFHISFVAILGGIVYNSLFYFRGLIRLTEGETLPSGDIYTYDFLDQGRFFSMSKLKGDTTLIRMHAGYKIGKEDKRAAYEIAVGEEGRKKQGIIYATESLSHDGLTYFNEREGYSVLIVLSDRQGREIYGAYIPLQSLQQKDESYLYTTGTKEGPGSFPFPQNPREPLFDLQVIYRPTPIKERSGEALFRVLSIKKDDDEKESELLADGKAAIGEKFQVGDNYLEVREVRYWVGMMVRHEPGQPIVLTSLWVGLGGMLITFIGRMRRGKGKPSVLSSQRSANSDL